MKIVYLSDYLTHHIQPLCEELFSLIENDFCFIETKPREFEKDAVSYERGFAYYAANHLNEKKTWRYKLYAGEEEHDFCVNMINNCDALIIGNASDDYIKQRLMNGKLTLRAHERWYRKKLPWHRFLRARIGAWLRHGRYRNLYMLCASAYTAYDTHSVGCFYNKCYKWGYYPKTEYYDVNNLMTLKDPCTIFWAGRNISWKHPELPIYLANYLKTRGVKFELTIAGIAEQQFRDRITAEKLEDCVRVIGMVPTEEIREYMKKSAIFIFTSDREEGWGAVLNEAMNSACAVVANSETGSAPFLIEDNKNGMLYHSKKISDFYEKVEYLLKNPDEQKRMGLAAYHTITEQWNEKVAAHRLITLIEFFLAGQRAVSVYQSGPASPATLIKDGWYEKNSDTNFKHPNNCI